MFIKTVVRSTTKVDPQARNKFCRVITTCEESNMADRDTRLRNVSHRTHPTASYVLGLHQGKCMKQKLNLNYGRKMYFIRDGHFVTKKAMTVFNVMLFLVVFFFLLSEDLTLNNISQLISLLNPKKLGSKTFPRLSSLYVSRFMAQCNTAIQSKKKKRKKLSYLI